MIATTTAITPNTLRLAASARGMTLSSESTSGSTAHAMSPPIANGNSVGHVATTIPATPRSTRDDEGTARCTGGCDRLQLGAQCRPFGRGVRAGHRSLSVTA